MDSDNGIIFEITAKHAALIPSLPNVKSLMPYVEAVAVVIGSRHIHSVFEDGNNIKIYLTDEKFVDILVNNGVTIVGRRVNVDYVVPRADKVILSNVDPIIPDSSLLNLLSFYGTPVSTIIHDKIATNAEYSHIECGSRKVYMDIIPGKKLPAKINFTYQSTCYHIDVLVEQYEKNENSLLEQEPFAVEDRSEDEGLEVNSIQSMKPAIIGEPEKQQTPKQIAYFNRRQEERKSADLAARQIKKRVKKRWMKGKVRRVKRVAAPVNLAEGGKVKRKKMEPSAKKITKSPRDSMTKVQENSTKKSLRRVSNMNNSIQDTSMELLENASVASNSSFTESVQNGGIPRDLSSITQYPFTLEELEKFMYKTRFHREPLQVAVEFLHEKQIDDGFSALQAQLTEFRNVCKDVALKLRIKRLVSLLKNAEADQSPE